MSKFPEYEWIQNSIDRTLSEAGELTRLKYQMIDRNRKLIRPTYVLKKADFSFPYLEIHLIPRISSEKIYTELEANNKEIFAIETIFHEN